MVNINTHYISYSILSDENHIIQIQIMINTVIQSILKANKIIPLCILNGSMLFDKLINFQTY